jgi:CHAT domain-containing protein/tetratricopeptide (TPR) repeat protein
MAAAALALLATSLRARPPTLDECSLRVQREPDRLESYMCYWFAARGGDPQGALRSLESLLSLDPSNHRARLYLAAIHGDLGHDVAKGLYRDAAEGFAEIGEPTGEVYARLSLVYLLSRADRTDEADRELERASRAADASGDAILTARVRLFQASSATRRGLHGEALALLHRAEEVAFPDGPVDLRAGILTRLGEAYRDLGLLERARETYAREADLMKRAGDAHVELVARLNHASVSGDLLEDERVSRTELLETLSGIAAAARSVANPTAEAWAHLLLARFEPSGEAIAHAERALRIYRSIDHEQGVAKAARELAVQIWVREPVRRPEAMRLLDDAIDRARRAGAVEELARGWMRKASLLQGSGSRNECAEASLEALEAIEKIRGLQPGGTMGAQIFEQWTSEYYRFSGALLAGLPSSPDPDADLEEAYRTIERMRNRVLLDAIDKDAPEILRRDEISEEIARIQTRLADPGRSGARRSEDLRALERLETEESLLRHSATRSGGAVGSATTPEISTLAEVRRHLAPDQAILSFQVAPERSSGFERLFRGGGWVLAVTREGARAFPIPDRRELRDRVGTYVGLVRRRDGSDVEAGRWLHDDVLAGPLEWMGNTVRRLVLVPDDCLHAVPFAALRPGAGAPPLGETHVLSRAPSITRWLQWTESRSADPDAWPRAVLALVGPDLGGTGPSGGTRTASLWLEGLRLGPLPRAAREARTLVRTLRREGAILEGPDANERRLKETDLSRVGILHFAAHAVIDDDHPDRSAIVLASGGQGEDGFLQVREIAELELRDAVVLVSACRSASGKALRGGTMLGIGQGFLRAGARAVVGNLWPLRDDDAERFVRDLGSSLARGRSVANALTETRARRIAAGDPAAAWAGMVVLGDGDFVPNPGGSRSTRALLVTAALGALLLVGLGSWALRLSHP